MNKGQGNVGEHDDRACLFEQNLSFILLLSQGSLGTGFTGFTEEF